MEIRRSFSTTADTERELNGSNVQEHWSRPDRVSSAHIVQSHLKLECWWWFKCCKGLVEVRRNSNYRNPVFRDLLRLLFLAGRASCG